MLTRNTNRMKDRKVKKKKRAEQRNTNHKSDTSLTELQLAELHPFWRR